LQICNHFFRFRGTDAAIFNLNHNRMHNYDTIVYVKTINLFI